MSDLVVGACLVGYADLSLLIFSLGQCAPCSLAGSLRVVDLVADHGGGRGHVELGQRLELKRKKKKCLRNCSCSGDTS